MLFLVKPCQMIQMTKPCLSNLSSALRTRLYYLESSTASISIESFPRCKASQHMCHDQNMANGVWSLISILMMGISIHDTGLITHLWQSGKGCRNLYIQLWTLPLRQGTAHSAMQTGRRLFQGRILLRPRHQFVSQRLWSEMPLPIPNSCLLGQTSRIQDLFHSPQIIVARCCQ